MSFPLNEKATLLCEARLKEKMRMQKVKYLHSFDNKCSARWLPGAQRLKVTDSNPSRHGRLIIVRTIYFKFLKIVRSHCHLNLH